MFLLVGNILSKEKFTFQTVFILDVCQVMWLFKMLIFFAIRSYLVEGLKVPGIKIDYFSS